MRSLPANKSCFVQCTLLLVRGGVALHVFALVCICIAGLSCGRLLDESLGLTCIFLKMVCYL